MGASAYSVDLRERVVRAFEVGGMTYHEVAALFGIGRSPASTKCASSTTACCMSRESAWPSATASRTSKTDCWCLPKIHFGSARRMCRHGACSCGRRRLSGRLPPSTAVQVLEHRTG